jgi:16S rRNA G1207 methylase RsmC
MKRKATFTKKHAAQNRAMIRRAKELLSDADLGTVANQHISVKETLKDEFPDVNDTRITHKIAQALRQLRYEKYHIID